MVLPNFLFEYENFSGKFYRNYFRNKSPGILPEFPKNIQWFLTKFSKKFRTAFSGNIVKGLRQIFFQGSFQEYSHRFLPRIPLSLHLLWDYIWNYYWVFSLNSYNDLIRDYFIDFTIITRTPVISQGFLQVIFWKSSNLSRIFSVDFLSKFFHIFLLCSVRFSPGFFLRILDNFSVFFLGIFQEVFPDSSNGIPSEILLEISSLFLTIFETLCLL